jgi:acyl-CoA thioester hydrolase
MTDYRFSIRVYWEDTDAGGVVYYANYLRFFERARTEWLRTLGVAQQRLSEDDGLIFIVAESNVRYLRPARLDDQLDVTVSLRDARRASLTLAQAAWRGHTLLAEGSVRVGCVHAGTFRPHRIPSSILQHLHA